VSVAGVVGILVTLAAVGVRDFPIPASPSTTTAPP
jgi:hypothetical protein